MTPSPMSHTSRPGGQAQPALYSEHMILRPTGTGGLIVRVFLAAPESECRPDMLVRYTRAPRNNVNSALNRLESLGLVSKRHDHHGPRLRGGSVPRWYRLTDTGHRAAVREGLTPAPIDTSECQPI